MTHVSSTTKRIIGWGLASILLFGLVATGSLFTVQHASATELASAELAAGSAEGACLTTGPAPSACPPRGIKQALEVVGEKIVGPAFRVALIQMLLNLSQFVLDRLAYEAAVAIASGGPGETSLFYQKTPSEAFGQLGLEVAGEAVGQLTDLNARELGIEFNLCDPGAALSAALALGIQQKYQPEAPECDILEVIDNWDSFGANIYQTVTDPEARQEAILSKFAESLKPGRNELSASLRLNIAIDQKVHEAKWTQFFERNEDDYVSVQNLITGNIETPSSLLQKDFERALEEADGDESKIRVNELLSAGDLIGGLAMTTAGTFTNTLLSTTISNIYSGFFDTEPLPNPFDVEAIGSGDRDSAEERLSGIISPSPIVNQEYNALNEFVVCPAGGGINRGLYNCVMDANFMAAVSRGTGSSGQAALTVQDAIDEGLLDGDWPLIPPSDESSNQDPFCYTYGYCYGNLVKLRNARIIPVGWELAALRNTGTTRATLQEIVDGFDDCTEDGAIGPASDGNSDSRWCHLIDPNWVLKYPQTQCRALVNGQIRISELAPGRNSVCVDTPSCIGEDNEGNCTDGYGYCVQEENVWRFRGEECEEEFATCLAVTNAETSEQGAYLVNTVEYGACGQDDAGCLWYRTNKYFDDAGTVDDASDDSYEWLADNDDYITSERDDDWASQDSSGTAVARVSYSYESDSGETYAYETYAYEDRIYLTHDAQECDEGSVGCTQLYEFDDDLYLNAVLNPSFEDDEDGDGLPDGWLEFGGAYSLTTDDSVSGSYSVLSSPALLAPLHQYVPVRENNFYTFSFYAKASVAGDQVRGVVVLRDEDGNKLNALGTSYSDSCAWDPTNDRFLIDGEPDTDDFERFTCTFTTVEDTVSVELRAGARLSAASDIYIDALQLEVGEDAHSFTEGYSKSRVSAYYQVAPDYLGCTGSDSDPEECDSYAQVCTAQDVGCNLYTPEDGDPSVPAIVSELDVCPVECVGYTTYKQEATEYESADFPLYFIADSAASCSEQYVGCDAYTNLGDSADGGEDVEYFTDLRFCLTEELVDATDDASTYFTWEGSDNEGYQLRTWYLLESNYSGSGAYSTGAATESNPELAPCTHVSMTAEDEVVCDDTSASMATDVYANDECDEYDDIFENPDCREFYDADGNIHYREYSDTISIDDACTPYRKDSSNQTDCGDSGGYWTDQGFCRYYVLAEESTECPAEQNGCRSYTGGAGRNSTTVLSENFETGTYEDFVESGSVASLSVSNESVASGGQSLYLQAGGSRGGFETVQIYLDTSDLTATYDEDDSSTCPGTVTGSGCEMTSGSETCTILDGEESCGALTDLLVGGKTFVLEFWAKGSDDLFVLFAEQGGASAGSGTIYDMVNLEEFSGYGSAGSVELDTTWELYSLGPFDTSDYATFDENAALRFFTNSAGEIYIDNITLKQVEENITVIKDSWVVPSTCDQTPDGVDSDQYYLGCEAYTDQNGNDENLYQFTQLCEEEVVGCEGFYHTANSESAYQQVFNARCMFSTDADFDEDEDDVVSSNTACEVDGVEYCTISAGSSFCTFDAEQVFASPLPQESTTSGYFGIVYGPETRVVNGDTPVYIVADDSYACASADMGCMELGQPTFSQDQSEVESFESVYYIDLPSDYDNILCDQEALFCEEWETTQDGNLYFKDPLDKTCEYKSNVTINNLSYDGWFKAGTNEPCYWTDTDDDGEVDVLSDDLYLINGTTFGVWRNGDEDYDQWVAQCDNKYDLCTEFIDTVDTEGGRSSDGTSYYFTNNDLLNDNQLQDSQRCNAQVSQKFGCALFHNTTDSELTYNAGASYLASKYADVFYGSDANDLVDPISCTNTDNGVLTLSQSNAEKYEVLDSDGAYDTDINLCTRRCEYAVYDDEELPTGAADFYFEGFAANRYLGRSCVSDVDCPTLTTQSGTDVEATCMNVDDIRDVRISDEDKPSYYLGDDTNEILKVNRDRECSAWLSCRSDNPTWNEQTGRYERICQSIDLCVEANASSTGSSTCTEYDPRDPIILSDRSYSERNVNWDGVEFSGMSIPYQLPVEHYDQFLVTPSKVCETTGGAAVENDNGYQISCSTVDDCIDANPTVCPSDTNCDCENVEDDEYRLVYNAGSCDASEDAGVGRGGECFIGYCEDSGAACGGSDDCSSGEDCVTGYCQALGEDNCSTTNDAGYCQCSSNDDCAGTTDSAGESTETCDTRQNICVNVTLDDEENRTGCDVTSSTSCNSVSTAAECIQTSDIFTGSCINDRCLADIADRDRDAYAAADAFELSDSRQMQCRGYPEVNSPHGAEVVNQWKTYEAIDDPDFEPSTSTGSLEQWSTPYTYVGGYNDATVCAVDADGNVTNCDCSYDRVEYGSGSAIRYVTLDAEHGQGEVPEAICVGGALAGVACDSDSDCEADSGGTGGTCETVTRQDSLYGWEGYCIEYDTSIQLNASNDEDDRACLSWIPVDQLSGSTNLYAKYEEAGFELESNYFCAELDSTWTVGRTGVACAEWQSNCKAHDGDWGTFRAALNSSSNDYECLGSVACPDGFMAIMTGCMDLGYPNGDAQKDALCGAGSTSNDSDCPFFCVPDPEDLNLDGQDIAVYYDENGDGVIDEDDENEDGELVECEGPSNHGFDVEGTFTHGGRKLAFSYDFTTKLVTPSDFEEAYEYYGKCIVSGLNRDQVEEMYQPYNSPSEASLGSSGPGTGYRFYPVSAQEASNTRGFSDFDYDNTVQTSCSSIVRISRDHDDGNAAFTDRVWDDSSTAIDDLGYTIDTEPDIFGITIDPTMVNDIDLAAPLRARMCEIGNGHATDYGLKVQKITNSGSSCGGSYNPQGSFEAQTFRDATLGLLAEETSSKGDYRLTCEWADDESDCESDSTYCATDGASICNTEIECDLATDTCDGGPLDGVACNNDSDCQVVECIETSYTYTVSGTDYTGYYHECGIDDSYEISRWDTVEDAVERMQEVFAKSYGLYDYQGYGSNINYEESTSSGQTERWTWDITDGSGDYEPEPPTVISLGECFGTGCYEGVEEKFSVNNLDSTDQTGSGTMSATAAFYMYADSEQMPIRTVILDWGDGDEFNSYSDPESAWPTDGQVGSTSTDNRYKNHRGLNSMGNDICGGSRATSDFGYSLDACSSSYISFNHDYVCSQNFLNSMQSAGTSGRECEIDPDTGNLVNSPCYGGEVAGASSACVFQPRVFVKDNWGWCASSVDECDAGDDYSSEYCYDGSGQDYNTNECDYDSCPNGSGCEDFYGGTADPWVYYDGFIVVEAE